MKFGGSGASAMLSSDFSRELKVATLLNAELVSWRLPGATSNQKKDQVAAAAAAGEGLVKRLS